MLQTQLHRKVLLLSRASSFKFFWCGSPYPLFIPVSFECFVVTLFFLHETQHNIDMRNKILIIKTKQRNHIYAAKHFKLCTSWLFVTDTVVEPSVLHPLLTFYILGSIYPVAKCQQRCMAARNRPVNTEKWEVFAMYISEYYTENKYFEYLSTRMYFQIHVFSQRLRYFSTQVCRQECDHFPFLISTLFTYR